MVALSIILWILSVMSFLIVGTAGNSSKDMFVNCGIGFVIAAIIATVLIVVI